MDAELQADGLVKGARKTYERLMLPGYRHSIPVQKMLKETRWPAFRDGQWGNHVNPPAPSRDV